MLEHVGDSELLRDLEADCYKEESKMETAPRDNMNLNSTLHVNVVNLFM